MGHSLGGAAVLHAAHQIPSINAVVTIGAPYHPQHALHLFEVAVEEIKQSGEAVVEIAGRKFMVRQTLLEDLKAQDPKEPIEKLSASLLIMHSPRDTVVGIENAAQFYKTAKHPKSFISLEPADHLLSNKQDSLYAADMIASWAKRYLDMPGRRDMQKDVEDNRVTVRTSADGFRTDMFVGDHALVADEPKKFGGTNQGPSPYDYLQAALGACTSMTLRMYAEKKAWPLHSCVVRLHYEKVHAVDCSDCDNPQNKIDRFVREIELMGPLNPEQCQKLLEIADKCPVHRTLANQVTIETRLIGCQEQTKK